MQKIAGFRSLADSRAGGSGIYPLRSKKNGTLPLTALETLRTEIHSLHDRYRQQAHGLNDVSIAVAEPAGACVVCGVRMTVQKTIQHTGITLAHGSFRSRETVYVCPSGCKREGKLVTARSSSLAKLLLPKSKVGYDVMVHIGRARFIQCRQRDEIRADLETHHGITLSTGEISSLNQRLLVYLEALHWTSPAARFVPQRQTVASASRLRPPARPQSGKLHRSWPRCAHSVARPTGSPRPDPGRRGRDHHGPQSRSVGVGLSRRRRRFRFSLRPSLAGSLRPLPSALGRNPDIPAPTSRRY